MRKITSLTTIFALALGLPACGDDKNETTNTPTTNTTPDTTGASETASGTTGPGTSEPTTEPTSEPTTAPATESATTVEPETSTAPATESATTTPATEGTTVEPGTTTDDGTSTGGVEPDTKWPPPDLMNMNMPCPENFYPASFVMGGLVCSPKCSGPGMICPSGDTGSAKGQCVFNPESTGAACKMGEMCMDAKETCQMTGGGGFACLKASDHCALLCNGGESCPAGMECMGMLVCQYPA